MSDSIVTYEVLTRELRASEERITKQLVAALAPIVENARLAHVDEDATQIVLAALAKDQGELKGTMKTWSDQYKVDRSWAMTLLSGLIIAVVMLALTTLTGCLERRADIAEDATPMAAAEVATPTPEPTETPTLTPLPPIVETTPLPVTPTPSIIEVTPFEITPRPGIHEQALPDGTVYIPLNRLRIRTGPSADYGQASDENGTLLFALAGRIYPVYTQLNLWPEGDQWLCLDEDCHKVVAFQLDGKMYGELRKP